MLKKIMKTFPLLAALLVVNIMTEANDAVALDKDNTLYLETEFGRVLIGLRPDKAPNHVARIKKLAREGFYDGIVFHRVIDGFMAQTGDPTGTGMGGSGQNLDAEFNDLPHLRGTLSMARTGDPNSADSQFFICLTRVPHLDNQYTAWGRVIGGMEFVDMIEKGEPPLKPSKIVTMRVAADIDG